MRKDIMIGLGAALATFAISAVDASASCRRSCRHYRPPPIVNYVPPPPAYRYGPRVQVFISPPGPRYYEPPPPYTFAPPHHAYDASFYGLPAYFGSGHRGYGYAPYYDAYRPAGVWIQIR